MAAALVMWTVVALTAHYDHVFLQMARAPPAAVTVQAHTPAAAPDRTAAVIGANTGG